MNPTVSYFLFVPLRSFFSATMAKHYNIQYRQWLEYIYIYIVHIHSPLNNKITINVLNENN